jgi:hypothetical protein
MRKNQCMVFAVLFGFGCGSSDSGNKDMGGTSGFDAGSTSDSAASTNSDGSDMGGDSGMGSGGAGGTTPIGGIPGSGGTASGTGGKAGFGGNAAMGGMSGGFGGTVSLGSGGSTIGGAGGKATSGSSGGMGGKPTGGTYGGPGGATYSGTGGNTYTGTGGSTYAGAGGQATGGTPGTGGQSDAGPPLSDASGKDANDSSVSDVFNDTSAKDVIDGQEPTITPDSGTLVYAGNPYGSCSAGVPTKGQPADTSNPTTVVGTGTVASCTFNKLQEAATQGGIITFDCGSSSVTIPITATLNLPTNKNTIIDGGNKITLDGGNAVQILKFYSENFRANDYGLTIQHITLINGKSTPTEEIPSAPPPCSQGWRDGQGGAIFMRDGNLTVIDSIFMNNHAAPLGPDTGGGAIYVVGSKNGVLVVGSTFINNSASNAGAVGCLFAELNVYNSLITNNTALGNGANGEDPDQCDANEEHQIGSGGNGGALYSDGNSVDVTLCGNAILDNAAGVQAFGGGLFFTSNNMEGTLTITDTTMMGNTGRYWTVVAEGSVDFVGSAVGTNAKSITVTNSALQLYP